MTEELVKRASDPAGRERLRREAAILRLARHPGVVGPATVHDDPGATTLRMPRLAAPDLAEAPPTRPTLAVRLGAALARVVADLHAVAIAHRDLDASHVLVDDGRPVLCGFGQATDHATDVDQRADDRALVDLVELLAASATDRGTRAERRAAALLRRVSAAARIADPPWPAERIADALAVPVARRLAPNAARSSVPRPALALRQVAAFAVVPCIVVLGVVVFAHRAGDHVGVGGAASPTSLPTDPTGETALVDAGGSRFAAGARGDVLAVGDWACTGEPSALLLRPATGELWLFRTLPAAEETATAEPLGIVPGARDLARDTASEAPCATPAVVDAHGRRIEVEAP